MDKSVLIIGGAGYIGGYTTDYLIEKGYEVCVYDKLIYESRYLKNVEFVYGDIRDTKKVITYAKYYDVIIIMAALVGDPACAVDITLTDAINRAAVNDICKKLPDKHIIFMSTCSVYGNQDGLLDENSPTNPLSAYAMSKLASEEYVRQNNGTIFRLGTVYGIGDRYSRIRLDLVVNVLTMKAVYEKEITVFGGDQWRPLISVRDIAGFIEEAIDKNIRGTYVLCKENVRMEQLAQRIAALVPGAKINITSLKVEDARNYRVAYNKAYNIFNYRPMQSIEASVNYMVKIFVENRIRNVYNFDYNNGNFIRENINTLKL